MYRNPLHDEHLVQNLEDSLRAEERDNGAPNLSRVHVPQELLRKPTLSRLIQLASVDWLVIGMSWVLLSWGNPIFIPLCMLVVAGRLHSFGVILHDAAHMPMRTKTLGWRVLEILAGYPDFTTINALRYHHIRHHRDSGMPTDPYLKPNCKGRPLLLAYYHLRGVILLPFWCLRGFVGPLAFIFPRLRTFYGRVFLQDKFRTDLTQSREVKDCAREDIGQLLFTVGVVYCGFYHPHFVFYGFIFPGVIAGLLAATRLMKEHDYIPNQDRTMLTIIRTTNDHGLGWVGKVFTAPRNIGYHITHHLHPQVSLESLPKLRAWYVKTYPEIYPGN